MKILIIGSGIAGLSFASFCEKLGLEYDIIEKQPDQSHHGFSLGMWSNGRNILVKLGLGDKFDEKAVPFRFFNIYNGNKEMICNHNLANLLRDPGMSYSHIHRKDLIDWLQSGLPDKKIKFSTSVTAIKDGEAENGGNTIGKTVTFSDGQKVDYDLVVAADGISSTTREQYFKGAVRVFDNWRVWYAWINPKYADKHSVSTYVEAGQYIVIFDEGAERALAVLVAKQDHSVWDAEENRLAAIRKLFSKEGAIIEGILDEKTAKELLPSDLSEVHASSMYSGRIALIGDAAHGFEPFAGLGGSMAMEDAYVLASELAQNSNIDEALTIFDTKRTVRIRLALKVTKRMQAISAVKSPIIRYVLNKILPFVSSNAFSRDFFWLVGEEI